MADNSEAKCEIINHTVVKHKGSSFLLREDFDSGPVSLDLIDDRLWLGNLKAACDVSTLNKHNISHILTIDSVPLPRTMAESKNIITKYIQVADIPKEDIISHFPEAISFIENGQKSGVVLVHCYYGMSRSAAVVIAYMMYKHKLSFEEAFYIVKAKRSITCPNNGFIAQLKLFGQMQCVLTKNYPKYKQFRLRMAAEHFRKVKILPQTCSDLVKPDPGLTQEKPDPHVYRCKKCRRIVASQSNIIPHIPHDVKVLINQRFSRKRESRSDSKTEEQSKWDLTCIQNGQNLIERLKKLACTNLAENTALTNNDTIGNTSSEKSDMIHKQTISEQPYVTETDINTEDSDCSQEICIQTYFIEPLAWMKDIHKNVQGKLYCPKCTNKLGSFSWIMGCQCPCGTKVAPAFYLVPSKVEKSNVVQNVQFTV